MMSEGAGTCRPKIKKNQAFETHSSFFLLYFRCLTNTSIYRLVRHGMSRSRSKRDRGTSAQCCQRGSRILSFAVVFAYLNLAMTANIIIFSFSRATNVLMTHFPGMRKGVLNIVELVFIPKQMARQFVLAVALKTSMVCSRAEFLSWWMQLH